MLIGAKNCRNDSHQNMNIEKECSNTIATASHTLIRQELYDLVDGLIENHGLLWHIRLNLYARPCDRVGFCVGDSVRAVGFETK